VRALKIKISPSPSGLWRSVRCLHFVLLVAFASSLADAASDGVPVPPIKPSVSKRQPAVSKAPPVTQESAQGPGEPVPSLGNDHVQSLEVPHRPYNSVPPTSGPHLPQVARWGIYGQTIPNELQVHNLEDGGVLIQYDCKNCDALIQKLEQLAQSYYKKAEEEKKKSAFSRYQHLIVAPYPGIGVPIALTAWTRIEKMSEFDEARIRRFVEAYIGIDNHPKAK